MATEPLNPSAVDAALEPGDMTTIPAAEVVRLREIASKAVDSEKATIGYVVETELTRALAAHPNIFPELRELVAQLIRPDLKATRKAEGWTVATSDGKSVSDRLKEFLESKAGGRFQSSNARPGPDTTTAGRSPIASTSGPSAPYLERVAAEIKQRQSQGFGRGLPGGQR